MIEIYTHMNTYRVSSEGEKGWTEIEAESDNDAAVKFQQQTGRIAYCVTKKPQGWGSI